MTTGKKYLDFLAASPSTLSASPSAHSKNHPREAARAIHFCNLYHNAYQGRSRASSPEIPA